MPTAQQAMFQAVCDLFGYDPARLTATERTKVGKAAKELVAAGATPGQVALAGRAWDRLFYPDRPLFSEMGLIAHWSKLRPLIDARRRRLAASSEGAKLYPEPEALPPQENSRRLRALEAFIAGEITYEQLISLVEGGEASRDQAKPGSRAGSLP
jgi:hypothetical protein